MDAYAVSATMRKWTVKQVFQKIEVILTKIISGSRIEGETKKKRYLLLMIELTHSLNV